MKDTYTVEVSASRKYNIYIGSGESERLCSHLAPLHLGKKIMIVTDDTVASLYLGTVERTLSEGGYECTHFIFPHGEESKSADTYIGIQNHLARKRFTRQDSILALGGGVVGDLAGFAASTYMRGIRYVQMPTTLLSATDSSVGGKCAIDIEGGKNLVGSFWQPSAVVCDVDFLDTLPREYFSDGMAEVIKYALLFGGELLSDIEGGGAARSIARVIERSVIHKRDIVALDEHDLGVRAKLNLGHTLAHAIEAHSGFSISHGRAVGIGMCAVTRGCVRQGLCSRETLERLLSLISDYELDSECPYPIESLLPYISNDKKCRDGGVELVLVHSFGDCRLRAVSLDALSEYFLQS